MNTDTTAQPDILLTQDMITEKVADLLANGIDATATPISPMFQEMVYKAARRLAKKEGIKMPSRTQLRMFYPVGAPKLERNVNEMAKYLLEIVRMRAAVPKTEE